MKANLLKKGLALALAAMMLLGCGISALADDNSGNSTGTGTSEGHVEKKATSVTLPTIPDGTNPFAYTMDPERLISETSGGRYTASEFPAAASDTGVYFNNGKKGGDGTDKDNIVYANTSSELSVTNKSSHNISLTVTAEAVATTGGTDIPLVAKDAVATADAASLYLGLVVGSETAVAITSTTAASKTVTITGTAANFKTAAKDDKSGYEYRELTLDEYKALDGNSSKTQDDFDATWQKTTFKLEGSVTSGKNIASTTTAPSVKVTWTWTDPTATPPATAPSVSGYTLADDEASATVSISLGTGGLAAENATVKSYTTSDAEKDDGFTLSGTTLTITKLNRKYILVTFDDDAETVYRISLTGDTSATGTIAKVTD